MSSRFTRVSSRPLVLPSPSGLEYLFSKGSLNPVEELLASQNFWCAPFVRILPRALLMSRFG
jgi:hypothetical protein